MCAQCNTEAVHICDVFGEWALYKATKTDEDWEEGAYGLLTVNDPDFMWKGILVPDPFVGLTDKEINNANEQMIHQHNDHMDCVKDFQGCILNKTNWMNSLYNLIDSAKEAGYDPATKRFESWFIGYLGKKITF